MAVKIPPKTIISLVITILIVIVVYAVIAPIFTGPEVTAWKTLGDEINSACGSSQDMESQVSIYLPDSKGNTPLNTIFYYLAVDQYQFILARRTYGAEKNDILVNFVDWIRNKPGNKVLRERTLTNCAKNNMQVCGQFDSSQLCNKFQFESEEGKEALTVTIFKKGSKVWFSYTKSTFCGDNRCCEGETEDNCPIDCKEAKPCKPLTEG